MNWCPPSSLKPQWDVPIYSLEGLKQKQNNPDHTRYWQGRGKVSSAQRKRKGHHHFGELRGYWVLSKWKVCMHSLWSSNYTPKYVPNEVHVWVHKEAGVRTSVQELFVITPNWKQHKCPSHKSGEMAIQWSITQQWKWMDASYLKAFGGITQT